MKIDIAQSTPKVIAFDADDTLWDNISHFEQTERQYCTLLSEYGSAEDISSRLFEIEKANMPILGYGCKAFTISLIENAVALSQGRVSAATIGRIVELGKRMLQMPCPPLPGVESVLQRLKEHDGRRMVVFTMGDPLDQRAKIARSGLAGYFSHVEVVAEKTADTFLTLCRNLSIAPAQLVMVGNSFKSDIAPALAIGARAVHIPFHTTWQLEHTEEFCHRRLVRLCSISQLPDALRELTARWPADTRASSPRK